MIEMTRARGAEGPRGRGAEGHRAAGRIPLSLRESGTEGRAITPPIHETGSQPSWAATGFFAYNISISQQYHHQAKSRCFFLAIRPRPPLS